jgi:putative nucleotidyltransferase with HDIG domain
MPETPRMQRISRSLADATDAKGGYDGHCAFVSELAQMLAAELDWRGRRLAQIRVAGLLHDVGKLRMPDEILLAPRALTPWEYAVVREHCTHGHAFLLGLGLEEEARWVLHHHENFDGSGYPSGLMADSIPMGARILHVADAFEAIIAKRPYSPASSPEYAVEELQRCNGQQFCPSVVAALERVLAHQGGALSMRMAAS